MLKKILTDGSVGYNCFSLIIISEMISTHCKISNYELLPTVVLKTPFDWGKKSCSVGIEIGKTYWTSTDMFWASVGERGFFLLIQTGLTIWLLFAYCLHRWTSDVQVNLCQKLLFLHQLTHNMTTDCSLNYKFNTWKFQAQTWGEHVVYRNCFWHSEQFLYTTCSPHVLQQ